MVKGTTFGDPLEEGGPDNLLDAARAAGAVDHQKTPEELEFDNTRTFAGVMGDGKIHFHDDLDKVEIETLVGVEFILKEVQWQPWEGEGNNGFYLVRCRPRTGPDFTTKMGGKALINRIRAMIAKRTLPIRVTLVVKESGQGFGSYYDFA